MSDNAHTFNKILENNFISITTMVNKHQIELKLGKQIIIVIIGTVFLVSVVFGQNKPVEKAKISPTIKGIAVLFRHGDRAPSEVYPNDPYKNCSWFGGLGALSEIGAQMTFNNGKRLGRRYRKLMPKNKLYSAERIYVISSAAERCLMSAQSFMAGFLPPSKRMLPINWQPVPINAVPASSDYMLSQAKSCPKYDHTLLTTFNFNDPDINELFNKNSTVLNYYTEKIGQDIKSLWDAFYLSDTLKVQIDTHLKIPKWAQEFYDLVLEPLSTLFFKRYAEAYVIKRVKGGALLSDTIKRLNDFANKESTVNINIYSAHDVTVATLLSVLEIRNQTAIHPKYAATLAIELHANKALNDDYEVKIAYFKDADVPEPIIVEIPGCKAPCSFKRFNVLVEPKLTRDFDKMCAK